MQSILTFLFPPLPNFEQLIEEMTEPTLSAPRGETARGLMEMLSGTHPEVRCEFVFTSLLARIHRDHLHSPWTSQVKCIMLLDRLGHDLHFSGEVAQMSSSFFAVERGEAFLGLRTQKLVFSLWELVRQEAKVLQGRENVLGFRRRQRRGFLQGLAFPQLLQQLDILFCLFRSCLEVARELQGRDIQAFKEELYSIQLVQYVALTLAHKMVAYYACSLLCFHQCTRHLVQQQERWLCHLQTLCLNFQSHSFELVRFLKVFKKARGFHEFNYEEFNPFQKADLPQAITAVLKEVQQQSYHLNGQLFPVDNPRLHVHMPAISEVNARAHSLYPRIKCPSEVEEKNTPFTEWHMSFSDKFPPEEIMTLDLIMTIRNKQRYGKEQEDVIFDLRNGDDVYFDEYCSFIESSSSLHTVEDRNGSLLTYKPSRTSRMQPKFSNVYSHLPNKWNSS